MSVRVVLSQDLLPERAPFCVAGEVEMTRVVEQNDGDLQLKEKNRGNPGCYSGFVEGVDR